LVAYVIASLFYACLAFVRVHGSVAAYRIKGETHVHLEVEQKLFVAEGTINGGIVQENEKKLRRS
jgi:hypothetical protein